MRIYGIDLATEWANPRRHRRLLNLIDHLPGDSAFVEAYTNDPQVALDVIEGRVLLPDGAEDSGPRMSEWSPVMEQLAQISDRLGALISATIAAGGAKSVPKIPPAPRPKTVLGSAQKEARRNLARQRAAEIIEMFTPGDPGSI